MVAKGLEVGGRNRMKLICLLIMVVVTNPYMCWYSETFIKKKNKKVNFTLKIKKNNNKTLGILKTHLYISAKEVSYIYKNVKYVYYILLNSTSFTKILILRDFWACVQR